jgi:nucleotide-binding universal stress UspA family protein
MTGRIVVGIDRSDGARRALQWAVEEAALRDAAVEAIHVWEPPLTISTPLGVAPLDLHEDDVSEEMRAIQAVVDQVDPAVDVTYVAGSPAGALLVAAADADLLVVGTRGRGGFAGLLLGSVSQQVAHHAAVPVVIVPPLVR